MRKDLVMLVTAIVLLGTTVSTKAASLLRVSNVGINQNNDNSLVLKHANELFGGSEMSLTGHASHASHGSHGSHASHASHASGR